MKHFIPNYLFPLSFSSISSTIIDGNPANLDNGIRALPRCTEAEEEQEEGAVI